MTTIGALEKTQADTNHMLILGMEGDAARAHSRVRVIDFKGVSDQGCKSVSVSWDNVLNQTPRAAGRYNEASGTIHPM